MSSTNRIFDTRRNFFAILVFLNVITRLWPRRKWGNLFLSFKTKPIQYHYAIQLFFAELSFICHLSKYKSRIAKTIIPFTTICFFSQSTYALDIAFDLGQIVGGGDGRGNQLSGNVGKDAIDQRNGSFASGNIWNGAGTSPVLFSDVAASPYIDGVFTTSGTNQITSSGVTYDVLKDDKMMMYDYITYNRLADGEPFNLNNNTYASGIGIHSGSGITFDLDAFRLYSNRTTFSFNSDFGLGGTGNNSNGARGYIILSSTSKVESEFISPIIDKDHLTPYQFNINIPASIRYLTLISGQIGDPYFDHT